MGEVLTTDINFDHYDLDPMTFDNPRRGMVFLRHILSNVFLKNIFSYVTERLSRFLLFHFSYLTKRCALPWGETGVPEENPHVQLHDSQTLSLMLTLVIKPVMHC